MMDGTQKWKVSFRGRIVTILVAEMLSGALVTSLDDTAMYVEEAYALGMIVIER